MALWVYILFSASFLLHISFLSANVDLNHLPRDDKTQLLRYSEYIESCTEY